MSVGADLEMLRINPHQPLGLACLDVMLGDKLGEADEEVPLLLTIQLPVPVPARTGANHEYAVLVASRLQILAGNYLIHYIMEIPFRFFLNRAEWAIHLYLSLYLWLALVLYFKEILY